MAEPNTNPSDHTVDSGKLSTDGVEGGFPLEMVSTTGMGEQHAITELDDGRFNLWVMLGVQYTISAAPLSICGFMQFTLGVGGSPFFFWGFLAAVFCQGLVVLSFAELGSSYPHVAGQTYWTSVLAPPKCKRFLTYLNGIMTIWGWIFALTGGYLLSSQFVVAGGVIVNPSYVPKNWHLFLLAVGMALISVAINTVLIKVYPLVNKFYLFWINGSVLYIVIVVLAKAHPKLSGATVFIDIVNHTGWDSTGLVFLMGMFPGASAVSLPDSVIHMAEELPDPQRRIPQVMIGSYLLSYLAGLIIVVVMMFCIVHPENLLEPLGGQPILQICWDAWNNKGWVITVDIIFIATFAQAANNIVTAISRIIWSFAKSGGLPFVGWVAHVDIKSRLPFNAIVLCAAICVLFDLLEFAPSYVLNAIYGSANICFLFSYGLPIVLLLMQQRQCLPKGRYFTLGKFGFVINILAVGWILLATVVFCIPLSYPVTNDNMNWAPVVGTTAVALSLLNWLVVRKTYEIPEPLHFERLQMGNVHA
ncbi:Amino acid/polyamine transporter I [Penicillium occitanis (nom. inval.)]|nr:Amino acid/polyamine transporter I [Penicillium occitanis (nom. inval.)]PCG88678.1 hypothetical protein PENOC_109870 [Penicillium occitanis (nom. inval.)]